MSKKTAAKSKTSVASKVIVGLALASVIGIVAAGVATITPKVRIEAPNGGETLTQGTTTTITWTVRNVSASFDVFLQDCSSEPCKKAPIVKSYVGQVGNNGRDYTYSWDAKTLLSGGDFTTITLKGAVYKILIYASATPTVYDTSDDPFTFGGSITSCSKEGYSCDDADTNACCTGLTCSKGICTKTTTTCKKSGEMCNSTVVCKDDTTCDSGSCCSGLTCTKGYCATSPVTNCTKDSDCSTNSTNKYCYIASDKTGTCVACTSDKVCATGQVCGSSHTCACTATSCGTGKYCGTDGTCKTGCSSDSNCATGQVCGTNKTCACTATSCGTGKYCGTDGTCQTGCQSDSNCASGQICTSGSCVAKCTSTSCGTGKYCASDGTCKTGCQSDSNCATGQVCTNGSCVTSPYCGDKTCNNSETCSTCSGDCGACPAVCGNGKCESGESSSNCCKDCGCATAYSCSNNACKYNPSCGQAGGSWCVCPTCDDKTNTTCSGWSGGNFGKTWDCTACCKGTYSRPKAPGCQNINNGEQMWRWSDYYGGKFSDLTREYDSCSDTETYWNWNCNASGSNWGTTWTHTSSKCSTGACDYNKCVSYFSYGHACIRDSQCNTGACVNGSCGYNDGGGGF